MEHVTKNETTTRITIEHCDAGWEVISWYGSEDFADDLYDTKSEAIKQGRTMFNSTPSAMTLEVGSKNDFNRTMTTLRSRKSDPGAFLDRCESLRRLFS